MAPTEAAPAAALLAAALGALCGCRDDATWAAEHEPDSIRVVQSSLVIKTGDVGQGRWKTPATYALVDAVNESERDLAVTLSGTLESTAGEELGALRPDSLRVPAGGQRTFALVDAEGKVRKQAAGASISVDGAAELGFEPPLVVTDGHVYDDRDYLDRERVVVAGRVANRAEGRARVVVMATFYDAEERPIDRPFTVLAVGGGQKRPVRFVGPPGSRSAYLFVGPASF